MEEENLTPYLMRLNSRKKELECALTAIYDSLLYLHMGEAIPVQAIVTNLTGLEYEEVPYFVKTMLINAIKDYEDIVEVYTPYLKNWAWSRHNLLEQALLLLAYVHFKYDEDKPDKAIVINNAVELAKKYLDSKDYRFINAILDKALND